MKKAIVGYASAPRNLGDYIQSVATDNLIGGHDTIIDRETMNVYTGEKVQLVMNGWYMENPKNWPPTEAIKPLIISFHLNPTAVKNMLTKEGIAYFKKHEPIGCRDYYTMSILQKHGIDAYFSGCLTLTLDRNDFVNEDTERNGVLIIGALDRIIPRFNFRGNSLKEIVEMNLSSALKFPSYYLKYLKAISHYKKHLLSKIDEPIEYVDQVFDMDSLTEAERFEQARTFLKKLASAKLVITSRIHSALPSVALGTPVIFLEDGLEHINQYSRIIGLHRFFNNFKAEDLKEIDLDNYSNPTQHLEFRQKLTEKVHDFLNSKA